MRILYTYWFSLFAGLMELFIRVVELEVGDYSIEAFTYLTRRNEVQSQRKRYLRLVSVSYQFHQQGVLQNELGIESCLKCGHRET